MTRKLLSLLLVLSAAACTRSGDTTATTNAAPPGPIAEEDRVYCGQLAGVYLRYEGSIGARIMPNVYVTGANNECAKGNYAAGIPVLEKVLRESDFTLPKRS